MRLYLFTTAEHEKDLEQLIRYYDTAVIRHGNRYLRKRVEWWTKDEVIYFIEDDNRNFVLDSSIKRNPSPHWWGIATEDGFEKSRKANSWGKCLLLY